MNFEEKYKELIKLINGDDENILDFNTFDGTWSVQANNDGLCPLGEVQGNICVSASSLDELLVKFEAAIITFNNSVKG